MDADFFAQFIQIMHSQGTPGFHTLGCYDKVRLVLGGVSDWHGSAKPAGLPGKGHPGTGPGTDFCTPEKPVPVARVVGFDPFSNSARKRERLPAQHSKLCISGHHNHQLPQKHEQGGEMGGASTHFLKRYVIY